MTPRKNLQRFYHDTNKKHFGGRLPRVRIKFGKTGHADGLTQITKNKVAFIKIDRAYKHAPRISETILLHEMIHVKHHLEFNKLLRSKDFDFDWHGELFHKELRRLMKRGVYDDLL